MDPFKALGIERRFDLDLKSIERIHRDLSKVAHPDRHGSQPPPRRAEALGRSVEINEAYRIVRDPVRRAEALFALAGISVGERNEPVASPELLGEILEKREALEDAKHARDLTTIHALAEGMEARSAEAERALGEVFARDRSEEELRSEVHRLGELRFYRRFLEEASLAEDALLEASA